MKNRIEGLGRLLGLLTVTFLFCGIVAFAQGSDISGTYEGMVKHPGAPEAKLSLVLKSDGGKVTASATHGDKTVEASDGKFENGTLTLNFGNGRVLTAKIDGDKLTGEAVDGTQKIPVELKKVNPADATANPAGPHAVAAAPVNLNGQWDAVADANGQPFPFLLTLKIDGENVTGGSSSQLGEATIKSGSWKDGKLVFQLDGQNGTISMSATVVEGKLTGDFDYAGQLTGRWVAVKKN